MTEMVERVARAICESTEADIFDELDAHSIFRAVYIQQARAAIEAMLEPTDEMDSAGNYEICPANSCECSPFKIYRAMVSAALGDSA